MSYDFFWLNFLDSALYLGFTYDVVFSSTSLIFITVEDAFNDHITMD